MSPLTVDPGEYRNIIGIDDLYIAEVTQDTAAGYVADTPEYLAPAAQATQQPQNSSETIYADDQPYDIMYSEGETVINLRITNLPMEMYAKLTGRVFDAASGRVFDNGGTPPDMALSFRSMKSNGSYRYYQYLKGRFEVPAEDATTRGDSPDVKMLELIYRAVRTVYEFDLGDINGTVKRVMGDDDTTNFTGATWYSQVQTPVAVAPSALALSSSDPTDGASGVLVTKTITLTFNNALVAGAINQVVVSKADGTLVACTNSLDATAKIMTVNPDASLDASSTYLVAIAVTDIYGDTLGAVVNFATA